MFEKVFCLAWLIWTGNVLADAPRFQDLMDPHCLPHCQRGMEVEAVSEQEGILRVVTTGARAELNYARGEVVFYQRIGQQREVARLRIGRASGPALSVPAVTHRGPGLAFARFASPKFDLRANGDSLFMFHVHEPIHLEVVRSMTPAFDASWKTNHLMLDEYGGFGIYCSQTELADHFNPYERQVAVYALPADAVLWIAVCPPKPYDWERSFHAPSGFSVGGLGGKTGI